ncbi:hypothetical protein V8G54_009315 [Vigna mungo]|uniref:Uncharacterized protein n=1 Tax=Vigna mungo TaxID=3915 RepID=A0AAQ3NVK0_VIGMU
MVGNEERKKTLICEAGEVLLRGIADSFLEVILREVFGGSVSSFVKTQRRCRFISCERMSKDMNNQFKSNEFPPSSSSSSIASPLTQTNSYKRWNNEDVFLSHDQVHMQNDDVNVLDYQVVVQNDQVHMQNGDVYVLDYPVDVQNDDVYVPDYQVDEAIFANLDILEKLTDMV